MKTIIIILALAVVAVTAFKRKYEDRFMDYGVYFIQNREYAGVLTNKFSNI